MEFGKKVRDDIWEKALLTHFNGDDHRRYRLEDQLTALLYTHLKAGRINTSQIPLYKVDRFFTQSNKTLKDVIPNTEIIEHEFALNGEKGIKWGAPFVQKDQYYTNDEYGDFANLSVDLAYLDSRCITFIEHKIGAGQTYATGEDNFRSAQLARYADWMISVKKNKDIVDKTIVLLTAGEFIEKNWYSTEFKEALLYNCRIDTISGYLIAWDDVLDAFTHE